MSDQPDFKIGSVYFASFDISDGEKKIPVYFSFRVKNLKDNYIELSKISPIYIEKLLLDMKEVDLHIKDTDGVKIFHLSNIRNPRGDLRADFRFKQKDKRAYFRLSISDSRENKFVLCKKFNLLSSRTSVRDVSLNPSSYKLITGISILVPHYVQYVINTGDILTLTGKKLKIKFEVRWFNEGHDRLEAGGKVLSSEFDSYKVLSSLYNKSVDEVIKKLVRS